MYRCIVQYILGGQYRLTAHNILIRFAVGVYGSRRMDGTGCRNGENHDSGGGTGR